MLISSVTAAAVVGVVGVVAVRPCPTSLLPPPLRSDKLLDVTPTRLFVVIVCTFPPPGERRQQHGERFPGLAKRPLLHP